MDDALVIAGKTLSSRLMLGTGKYASPQQCVDALDASGCQVVTVAIRRLDLDNPNATTELDYIDWQRYTILPNTAGCANAEDALLTARLARELCRVRNITPDNWVKLEVQPDPRYLLPDPIDTLRAAEAMVKDGFVVLPYIHADPMLAKRLEAVGCATLMPLGSPIGSGRGIFTLEEIQIIIENAGVPVVVDAGLGAPSEASLAFEIGADAVLVNTAIARATDPAGMAHAFKLGAEAGRRAYNAGRIEKKAYASASSPLEGMAARR